MKKNNINYNKVVAIDLDFTLYDLSELYIYVHNETRKKFGFNILSDYEYALTDINGFLGYRYKYEKMFSELGCSDTNLAVLVNQALTYHYKIIMSMDLSSNSKYLFDGALDNLILLQQLEIPVVAITNCEGFVANKILAEFGILKYFMYVSGAEYGLYSKPNPQHLFRSLAPLGKKPDENVYLIGDSDIDVICGQKSNVQTILFGRKPHANIHPNYWVYNHLELKELFIQIFMNGK